MRHLLPKKHLCFAATLLLAACATMKPPSPEEQAFALLELLKEAIEHKDKETVMELLSPAFHHPEVGDRSDAYAIMSLTLESGFEGAFTLNTQETRYTKEKATGQARLSPIPLTGGQNTFELALQLTPASNGEGWQILTFSLASH